MQVLVVCSGPYLAQNLRGYMGRFGWGREVDVNCVETPAEAAMVLRSAEAARYPLVLVDVSAVTDTSQQTAFAVLTASILETSQRVIVGRGYPNQRAQLEELGCHALHVGSDIDTIGAYIYLFYLGRKSNHPA